MSRIYLRIDEELKKKFLAISKKKKKSASDLIREFIEKTVQEDKKENN